MASTSDMRRVHLAVVIDYDHGSVLADDVEVAIEQGLERHDTSTGTRLPVPPRTVKAKAVVVSEGLHDRLLATRQSDGDGAAYIECMAAQEAAYWEARRQGMNLNDHQIGDLLRAAAPHLLGQAQKDLEWTEHLAAHEADE